MAIEVRGITLVCRKVDISRCYPGGIDAFKEDSPLFFAREEESLITSTVMNARDLWNLRDKLIAADVQYVVVDMFDGPKTDCDWLEFERGQYGPVCKVKGEASGRIKRWEPDEKNGPMITEVLYAQKLVKFLQEDAKLAEWMMRMVETEDGRLELSSSSLSMLRSLFRKEKRTKIKKEVGE